MRNVGLGRPVLRQIFEELHIRRDPERDPRVIRPSDHRTVVDRGVLEAARCEGHRCFRSLINGSAGPPLDRLRLEPVDDLAACRLPNPLPRADMAEYLVEMPDAPGLA